MRLLLFLCTWLMVTKVYCQEKTHSQQVQEWNDARKAKEAFIKAKQDSIKKLSQEEITKILDLKNYPNYDLDMKWLNMCKKRYSAGAWYEPKKALNFIHERDSFLRHADRVEGRYLIYWLTHEIKLYEKAEVEKLFAGTVPFLRMDEKALEDNLLKDVHVNYTREPADYVKAIKKYIDDAKAESAEYKSHPREGDGGSDPRDYYKDRIPDMIYKAEIILYYFEKKVGANDMVYSKLLAEKNVAATELQKDAMNAYAVVKPPTTKYAGADAASLKTLITETLKRDYPDIKILKVYLTGTKWEKDEGYNYSFGNSSASQTLRSESNLDAAVAIENKDNPKTCYIFFGKINKDNTNGKKYVFFSIDHYKEQTIDEVFIEKVVKK